MFFIVLFLGTTFLINAQSIPRQISNSTSFFEVKDQFFQIYFLGESSLLNLWEKKYFSSLYILHLLTPSGLHLSSLFLPIKAFINKFIKNYKVRFYTKIIIILPLCFIDSLHSLRRVAIFYILISLHNGANSSDNIKKCFWFTFIIDFINGSYHKSPLSFSYSFLFWGSIISNIEKSKIKIICDLGVAQMLLSYLLGLKFHPIGFFMGQLITFTYCLFFPILVLIEPISISLFSKTTLIPLIHQLLYGLGKYLYKAPAFNVSVPILLLFLIPNKRIGLIFLLFTSDDCNRSEKTKPSLYFLNQSFLKNKEIDGIYGSPKKSWIKTKQGDLCTAKLKNSFWTLKCKNLPSL